MSPVLPSICPLLILLAEQAQCFQRVGAGVLEVLTTLRQEIREIRGSRLTSPAKI